MLPVAVQVLGTQPNAALSSAKEKCFGSRGALKVNVEDGTYYDHSGELGNGGVLHFLKAKNGLETAAAMQWLRDNKHLPASDFKPGGMKIVAEYDYVGPDGKHLFQVVRLDPKDFRQRRRGDDGKWVWKMGGMPLCLYRLPQVSEAVAAGRVVYIAEGEKGVAALVKLGVDATCSPGGAGK